MCGRSEDVILRAETSVAELNPVSVLGPWPVATATDSRATSVGTVSGADGAPQFIRDIVDKVDDSLPENTVMALEEILLRQSDVFSQLEDDLGLTTLVTHQIDTANARPVKQSQTDTDRQTDRTDNGLIASGEPFYKRSPKMENNFGEIITFGD